MKGFLDGLIENVKNVLAVPGYMARVGIRGDKTISRNSRQEVLETPKGEQYAVNEWGRKQPFNPLGDPMPEQVPQITPEVFGVNTVEAKEAYQPQNLDELKMMIDRGFQSFNGGKSPVATLSGELAQTGKRLSDSTEGRIDPLMAAVVALKESRGGLDPKPKAAANYWNIMKPGAGLADYGGNPARAISSGNPNETLNFEGLLRQGGNYQQFRDSGNLSDFFGKFTPASDPLNPGINEQVGQYNKLRELFN